jgi:hypothetical protein
MQDVGQLMIRDMIKDGSQEKMEEDTMMDVGLPKLDPENMTSSQEEVHQEQ